MAISVGEQELDMMIPDFNVSPRTVSGARSTLVKLRRKLQTYLTHGSALDEDNPWQPAKKPEPHKNHRTRRMPTRSTSVRIQIPHPSGSIRAAARGTMSRAREERSNMIRDTDEWWTLASSTDVGRGGVSEGGS